MMVCAQPQMCSAVQCCAVLCSQNVSGPGPGPVPGQLPGLGPVPVPVISGPNDWSQSWSFLVPFKFWSRYQYWSRSTSHGLVIEIFI